MEPMFPHDEVHTRFALVVTDPDAMMTELQELWSRELMTPGQMWAVINRWTKRLSSTIVIDGHYTQDPMAVEHKERFLEREMGRAMASAIRSETVVERRPWAGSLREVE